MRRHKVLILLIVGVALAGASTFYWLAIQPRIQFSEEKRAIERQLLSWWEGRPPPGIDAHHWRETWVVAYNGFGNVCYSPDHVSLGEMQRLRADVQAKMNQPATLASLRWFWDRLSETGPHGNRYIQRMTPLLDEAIGEAGAVRP